MLTRSKARIQQRIEREKMAAEQVKEVPSNIAESEEMESYNQLGDQVLVERDERETREELAEIRARGQSQSYEVMEREAAETPRKSELQIMLEMLTSLAEGQKKIKEELKEDNKIIRAELTQVKEEIKATNNKFAIELQVLNQALREEIKNSNEGWKEEIKKTEQKFEKIVKQSNENFKSEVNKSTKNLSENLNRINQEMRKELKEVRTLTSANKEENTRIIKQQENMEEQIRQLAEEKGRRIDEVKEKQDQLQQKVTELEARPAASNVHPVTISQEVIKEVKYNGRDPYPMEFLHELKQVREQFYPNGGIKWIGRHFEAEATVWWRIVQHQLSTFEQFEHAFMNKFWSQEIQEEIRDFLEFGRYKPQNGLTMIQYFEREVLQCRQLTPPITEQHLIRKLARHYGRDIEIAIITRGINTVAQFEHLLREFTKITERDRRNYFHRSTDEGTPIHNTNVNEPVKNKSGWRRADKERYMKREGDIHAPDRKEGTNGYPQNVNSLVIEGQRPSTSAVTKNDVSPGSGHRTQT
jgi:DNA repair exonuclease SbcCD ATPase subunit